MTALAHALLAAYGGVPVAPTVLLHFDGLDGSTTFRDEKGHTVTPAGDAQIDTAQSVFGGASGLFGTGSLTILQDSTELTLGTGDLTISFRCRPTSVSGSRAFVDFRPANGLYPTIYVNGTSLRYLTNSADRITGATTLAINTWYHVELVRASGTTKLFLNGTQEGSSYTDSNNYGSPTSGVVIANNFIAGSPYAGHVDELLIIKGMALHTANFTPPAMPYSLAA